MGKVDGKKSLTVPSWESVATAFAVGTFPTNGRRDGYSTAKFSKQGVKLEWGNRYGT